MKKKYFLLLCFLLVEISLFSQKSTHKVFFTDKAGSTFEPTEYFDAKALERRKNQGIAIDSTDFPVSKQYIEIIASKCRSLNSVSRWFNLVFIEATSTEIAEIAKLPFVSHIQPVLRTNSQLAVADETPLSFAENEILRLQTSTLNITEFHTLGFTGKGIRVAIFDAGFPNAETNPALEHVIANKRIIATNDFIKNRSDVFKYNMHGTAVLSCVAGIYRGTMVGSAPEAEFLLARTESVGETIAEEEHWLAAAEWADKMGAHIINSSLGYTFHRYFPNQMNGEISLIAKAANTAVRKGILVVSSMGNDGNSSWKYLSTPADADSVLSVGAINPFSGYRSDYSSYGPTADNRLKPNVTAQGHVMAAEKGGLTAISGTSFSSPLVAGFAACALQSNPKLSPVKMKQLIEQSGSLYPYFDYAHGYGVPDAKKFLAPENKTNTGLIKLEQTADYIYISVDKKQIKYGENNYLYFHIENKAGYLLKYGLVKVEKPDAHSVRIENNGNEKILRVHFNGFTEIYPIKEFIR